MAGGGCGRHSCRVVVASEGKVSEDRPWPALCLWVEVHVVGEVRSRRWISSYFLELGQTKLNHPRDIVHSLQYNNPTSFDRKLFTSD